MLRFDLKFQRLVFLPDVPWNDGRSSDRKCTGLAKSMCRCAVSRCALAGSFLQPRRRMRESGANLLLIFDTRNLICFVAQCEPEATFESALSFVCESGVVVHDVYGVSARQVTKLKRSSQRAL